MNATRYIAKCLACKCITSALSHKDDARKSKAQLPAGSVYTHEATGAFVIDCRQCGKPRYAKMVRGVYSAKHECSARCMSSTGTQCECSCAGKNHGASFSA